MSSNKEEPATVFCQKTVRSTFRIKRRTRRFVRVYIQLFVLACVLPPAVSVSLLGLVITPLRVLSIILFIQLVGWFCNRNIRCKRTRLIDYLVIAHCSLVFLSILYVHGIERAAEAGGVYVLEFFVMYVFGRYLGTNPYGINYLAKAMMVASLIFIPFAYIESISGTNYIALAFKTIGFSIEAENRSELRLGLARASLSLPHPILYGLFTSCFLGLFFYTTSGSRVKKSLIFVVATIPSLSSAPLLAIAIQVGLISWNILLKKIKSRWQILIMLAAAAITFIQLVSQRDAITVLMDYLTLNSQTGYYRQLIWTHGTDSVINNIWFGIGFNDWERPDFMYSSSIDSFWLVTAIRYGLPATICLLSALLLEIVWMAYARKDLLTDLRLGWIITMVGIIFVGITVHFWLSTFALFSILMGIGASASSKRFRQLPQDNRHSTPPHLRSAVQA